MNLSSITSIFTGNPWVYAGILAVGIASGATSAYLITASVKDNAIKDLKLETANKSIQDAVGALSQYQADAGRIHGAADGFAKTQSSLTATMTGISRNFANAIKDNPLPASCPNLDAGRMRSLSAAVTAANQARAAGKPVGPAVP